MFVRAPAGELRQILKDLFRVGVKDVGTIAVYEDAIFVVVIVSIPPDVTAAIDQKNFLPKAASHSF
jgi:ribosomal protein S12 methylthiotransferase accessory factor YcaO